MNFTLDFQNEWEPPRLVRRGGQHSPLEGKLDTVEEAQYEKMYHDGSDDEQKSKFDFVLDQAGNIIPNISTGLSTYTDEIYLPDNFQKEPERLWKLENETTYRGDRINLTYPKEIELHPDPNNNKHFGIKPVENVLMKPAKFRQMLRCLPWVKIYTYGDVKKAKEKETKENKKAKEKQKQN